MSTRTRSALRALAGGGALALLTAGLVVLPEPEQAASHGGLTFPATRTYACYVDGISGGTGGGLNPQNPICADLLAEAGNYPFYNWFGNLLSDAGGRHREVVPDGKLCGPGAAFDFVNTPSEHWPTTNLQAGSTITFQYNAWAKHPGTWSQYVTKDGWDPSQPLGWDDLEPAPFNEVTNPPLRSGGPEGDEYYWNATLPQKSGQHIIYSIWTRSDSPEAFYNCADVNFGGEDPDPDPLPDPDAFAPTEPGTPAASSITGTSAALTWAASTDNVGVTRYAVHDAETDEVLATSANPTASLSGLTPDTEYSVYVRARDAAGNDSRPSPTATFRTTAASTSAECSVDYEIASSWGSGFVANVTVHNDSMTPIDGWTLEWDFPGSEQISNAWGATATQSGSSVSAENAPWSATIGHHGSVSFGFQGTGSPGTPSAFTLNGEECS